jgi:hypothetical protein
MKQRALLFAGILLLSACAQRYAAPANIRTDAGPDETFDCATKQLEALGYRRSSYDTDAHRISGTKIDLNTRRPDTQFRRILHRIEVEVSPEADGRTSLQAVGRTYAEYTTQRGPTEVEENASEQVKTDTQRLLKQCGS